MKKLFLILTMVFCGIAKINAQTEASYPGGQEAMVAFIDANIHYPQAAIDNLIEGTVVVAFNVETDGKLKDIKVVRPLDPDLETEAVRVVTLMPVWIPATDATGKAILQHVEIPVKFRLPY